jgi:hypothetical protein
MQTELLKIRRQFVSECDLKVTSPTKVTRETESSDGIEKYSSRALSCV